MAGHRVTQALQKAAVEVRDIHKTAPKKQQTMVMTGGVASAVFVVGGAAALALVAPLVGEVALFVAVVGSPGIYYGVVKGLTRRDVDNMIDELTEHAASVGQHQATDPQSSLLRIAGAEQEPDSDLPLTDKGGEQQEVVWLRDGEGLSPAATSNTVEVDPTLHAEMVAYVHASESEQKGYWAQFEIRNHLAAIKAVRGDCTDLRFARDMLHALEGKTVETGDDLDHPEYQYRSQLNNLARFIADRSLSGHKRVKAIKKELRAEYTRVVAAQEALSTLIAAFSHDQLTARVTRSQGALRTEIRAFDPAALQAATTTSAAPRWKMLEEVRGFDHKNLKNDERTALRAQIEGFERSALKSAETKEPAAFDFADWIAEQKVARTEALEERVELYSKAVFWMKKIQEEGQRASIDEQQMVEDIANCQSDETRYATISFAAKDGQYRSLLSQLFMVVGGLDKNEIRELYLRVRES